MKTYELMFLRTEPSIAVGVAVAIFVTVIIPLFVFLYKYFKSKILFFSRNYKDILDLKNHIRNVEREIESYKKIKDTGSMTEEEEQEWVKLARKHKEINQMPTFFEFITLLALVIFKEENVEISIIEVGLGGRLDSTNVIESDISVITGISRDHTKILGNTLIKISNEKAGIIKLNTPVILSHQIKRVSENIQSIAKSKKAKIYNSSDIKIKSKIVNTKKSFIQKVVLNDKYKFNLSLIGDHQLENLRTAIKAIEIFYKLKNEKINWASITKNISKIKMIGRCEVIKVENNYWIADGAQNNKSSRALIRTIKKLNFDIKKILWIYGSSDGHSSKETVKSLEKLNPKIILTKSRLPKAKSPINITKELKNLNLDIIELTNNSQEAFTKAKEIANAGDCIVAFGSLYIAAEFVELIKNIKPEYYIYE